jgi:hypothetical protein
MPFYSNTNEPQRSQPGPTIGEERQGLAQSPEGHLYQSLGAVVEILQCTSAVQVEPESNQSSQSFHPLTYADLAIRSTSLNQNVNAPGPDIGSKAHGFWMKPSGAVTHGIGNVVKVWENFTVCLVEPAQGQRRWVEEGWGRDINGTQPSLGFR